MRLEIYADRGYTEFLSDDKNGGYIRFPTKQKLCKENTIFLIFNYLTDNFIEHIFIL